jgi:hypothetical protein
MKNRDPNGLDGTPDNADDASNIGDKIKNIVNQIVGYLSSDGRTFAPLGENEVRVWGGKHPLIPIYGPVVPGGTGPINGHGNTRYWYDHHAPGAFKANGLGQVRSNPYAEFPQAAALFGSEGRDIAYEDELNKQAGMVAMEFGVTVLVPEVLPELLGGLVATEAGTVAVASSAADALPEAVPLLTRGAGRDMIGETINILKETAPGARANLTPELLNQTRRGRREVRGRPSSSLARTEPGLFLATRTLSSLTPQGTSSRERTPD